MSKKVKSLVERDIKSRLGDIDVFGHAALHRFDRIAEFV